MRVRTRSERTWGAFPSEPWRHRDLVPSGLRRGRPRYRDGSESGHRAVTAVCSHWERRGPHGAAPGTARARSGTGVGPRPAAVVPAGALSRSTAAAYGLHGGRMPARLRWDVLPADVRESAQPGPAQRLPADRLVAPALPRVHLTGGVADAVVGVGPLVRGCDRRVAYSHGRTDTRVTPAHRSSLAPSWRRCLESWRAGSAVHGRDQRDGQVTAR